MVSKKILTKSQSLQQIWSYNFDDEGADTPPAPVINDFGSNYKGRLQGGTSKKSTRSERLRKKRRKGSAMSSTMDEAEENVTQNSKRVQPGAMAMAGFEESSPIGTDEETGNLPSTSSTNYPMDPITAVLVEEGKEEESNEKKIPLVGASVWKGYWTWKKLGIALGVLIFVAAITAIAVVFAGGNESDGLSSSNDLTNTSLTATGGSSSGPPTESPTFQPTSSPTLHPRQWVQIGDLTPQWSEDEFGVSVAMSKHGGKAVVGATGWIECEGHGRFNVFEYRENGYWENRGAVSGFLADELGRSVAISDDGTTVAAGAPFRVIDDATSWPCHDEIPRPGVVRIYKQSLASVNGTYEYNQLGSDISVNKTIDRFGWTVDLSADGNILAAGDLDTCHVRVYHYLKAQNEWLPMGDENGISCQNTFIPNNQSTAAAISLSSDGQKLAIGAPGSINPGQVRIYQYDASNTGEWIQFGQTISFGQEDDLFGASLSLSDNGLIVAIGSPGFGDSISLTMIPSELGMVQVFQYSNTSGLWEQVGQDLIGNSFFDMFGMGTSLSGSGDILAVGVPGSNENGDDSGSVQAFRFENASSTWRLVGGGPIVGPITQGKAGGTVAVSQDGNRIIVGVAPDFTSDGAGFAQMYEIGYFLSNGSYPLMISGHGFGTQWTLERLDVDSEERAFAILSNPLEKNGTSLDVPFGGIYKVSFKNFFSWFEDDDLFASNGVGTYFISEEIGSSPKLLAAGSFMATARVFLAAESHPMPNRIGWYGFETLPHLSPQIDSSMFPVEIDEAAFQNVGLPCISDSVGNQGRVAVLQLNLQNWEGEFGWIIQSGETIIAENNTIYSSWSSNAEEICVPDNAAELVFAFYENNDTQDALNCESDFGPGDFLLAVDVKENYVHGIVQACNTFIIDRVVLEPTSSPSSQPTYSPSVRPELRDVINIAINFGERPEEVEWILKAVDLVVNPDTGRWVSHEMVIACGMEYSEMSAGLTKNHNIDISGIVLSSSLNLKLKFYYIEELNENEEYSEVRVSHQVLVSEEDVTNITGEGNIIFLLPAAPESRLSRKSVVTIPWAEL